jgi:hypothetical protein
MYFKDVDKFGDIFKDGNWYENFSRLKYRCRCKGVKDFYDLLSLNYIVEDNGKNCYILDDIETIVSKWENFYIKSIEKEETKRKNEDTFGGLITELFIQLSKIPEKERYKVLSILEGDKLKVLK